MRHTTIPLVLALITAVPVAASAAGSVRLPASGQTACFDSTGTSRACAGTGEDGEIRAGLSWPEPRFTVNNATVTDNLTGLTWTRHANAPDPNAAAPFACPNAESDMSWQRALEHVACLNSNSYGGFSDWRLPNLNELESTVHAGVPDSSGYLSSNGFGVEGLATLVQPSRYWSSTSDASSGDSAWDVSLAAGDLPFSSVKVPVLPGLDTRSVWPVRGSAAGPAALPATGQRACFDGAGNAQACTGTGQDGESRAGAEWPVPRFRSDAAGSIAFDRLTGLVWSLSPRTPVPPVLVNGAGCAAAGTPIDWQQALDHVACLNNNAYLGESDWRVPNRRELRSLADYSASAPALAEGHPFAELSAGDTFWSSTSDAAQPQRAWTVNLVDGGLSAANKINGAVLPVWPVRSAETVPPAVAVAGETVLRTNLRSRPLAGTTEAGATVTVAVNGGTPAAAAVTGGNWSHTVGPLAPGDNAVLITASDFFDNQSAALATITLVVPDGLIAGNEALDIGDALKALRIAVRLDVPDPDQLLRGDVAPLNAPDGRIDVADALMILRKVVGLEAF